MSTRKARVLLGRLNSYDCDSLARQVRYLAETSLDAQGRKAFRALFLLVKHYERRALKREKRGRK